MVIIINVSRRKPIWYRDLIIVSHYVTVNIRIYDFWEIKVVFTNSKRSFMSIVFSNTACDWSGMSSFVLI